MFMWQNGRACLFGYPRHVAQVDWEVRDSELPDPTIVVVTGWRTLLSSAAPTLI